MRPCCRHLQFSRPGYLDTEHHIPAVLTRVAVAGARAGAGRACLQSAESQRPAQCCGQAGQYEGHQDRAGPGADTHYLLCMADSEMCHIPCSEYLVSWYSRKFRQKLEILRMLSQSKSFVKYNQSLWSFLNFGYWLNRYFTFGRNFLPSRFCVKSVQMKSFTWKFLVGDILSGNISNWVFSNRKIVPTTILLTENRSATQMPNMTYLYIPKVWPLALLLSSNCLTLKNIDKKSKLT